MNTWSVTLKTASQTWSTINVEADSHFEAVAHAQRLLGHHPVSRVV